MNLIEKVAKAIWKYQEVDKQFDFDKPATPMADLIKAMSIDEAKCCIEAMPSIKWQKIDTLPEAYKNSKTQFLVWSIASKQAGIGVYGIHSKEFGFYDKNSHWAEINAPEEE